MLLNGGDGSFRARCDYRAGGTDLAIGDLNGDGKLDLATTSRLLLNRGDGSFRAGRACPTGSGGAVAMVGSDYSQVFKRGLVMRQKPAPSAVRPNGDKVDLVVSLGPKQ